MDKNIAEAKIHNIIMENRGKLTVSGVEDVESFNEESVVLDTIQGTLTVEGSGLHINKLNVQTGELTVNGEISGLVYHDEGYSKSNGFFGRIFK